MKFKEMCEQLEAKIQETYTDGITMAEAERVAGQCLHAQMLVSNELKKASLNARMRKSGLKAIKASVYLAEATKSDKKPSDVMLNAIVDSNEIVNGEQTGYDEAETDAEELQRLYDIFGQFHVYTRQISKGSMGA